MHPYQRGRASISGLMVELQESIETGRLVGVVMTRLVRLGLFSGQGRVNLQGTKSEGLKTVKMQLALT
jgi:hypothetical protein